MHHLVTVPLGLILSQAAVPAVLSAAAPAGLSPPWRPGSPALAFRKDAPSASKASLHLTPLPLCKWCVVVTFLLGEVWKEGRGGGDGPACLKLSFCLRLLSR